MSHAVSMSDAAYQTMEALASQRGQTPEQLLSDLLAAAWEAACARYDAAFENDPAWLEGAREALEEAEADSVTAPASTEQFLAWCLRREK
jgi:hypothetical protein